MTPGGGGHALADALGYPVPGEPSRLVRSLRAAASTAPASAVLARTLRPADALLSRWGAARAGGSGLLVGLPVVTLTTTGARSGLPRAVPLIPVVTEAAFAVLGTNFGGERTPAWVRNLEANPEASIAFAGRDLRVRTRQLEGAEQEALLAAAVRLYPGFGRYVVRAAHRRIRVVALEALERPAGGSAAPVRPPPG